MTYQTHRHHNGNLLAAVDVETTGRIPGFHDVVQIGIQPLTIDYEPHPSFREFYTNIRPEYPGRAESEALRINQLTLDELELAADRDEVEDALVDWFNSLNLAFNRRLIPVAHNFPFESAFLKSWLGVGLFDDIFLGVARDSQALAVGLNDMAAAQGRGVPFKEVNLKWLSTHFGIENPNEHDALCDAITGARVYGALTKFDVLL